MDTAGNDGAGWPLDNAGLDLGELVFIQNALTDNQNARLNFMFGHHPILRPDLGFKLGEGSDEIQEMLGDFNVRSYFYGHTHEWRELYWADNDKMPITLHENVTSLGKADDKEMLLASVDNDILHLRKVTTRAFPWVIVTTPANINQGGGNPWAVDVPAGMEKAPVRALAFTNDPFITCELRLDDGGWHIMDPIGDHIFEGFMDTRGMESGAHTIEVRAMPGPSTGHKIMFQVTAFTCGNGIDEDEDGLTDFPDDPGCESVSDPDEYNDPIVVEEFVEQTDEDIIEPEDVIVTKDVQPDLGPDTGTSTDTATTTDVTTGMDVQPEQGPGQDTAEYDQRELDQNNIDTDASLEEATGQNDDTGSDSKLSGGCSAGGSNSGLPVVLILVFVAAILATRRYRETSR